MEEIMKKTVLRTIFALLFAGMLLVAFTGCEWLFGALAAPQGYVVDAKSGDPISGASVTLTSLETGGSSFTAVTGDTGYYTFLDVAYGEYELTATSTGMTFTKQVVKVSGLAQTLPNIGGFANEENTLSIIVLWERDFEDVDAYLSYPTAVEDWDSTDEFYQTLGSSRTHLGPYPDTVLDGTTVLMEKDVDNYGAPSQEAGGPETFTVTYMPFAYGVATYGTADYVSTGDDDASKLPAGNYDYKGAMIYYLNAFNADNPSTDTVYGTAQDDALLVAADASALSAKPVVYVFYGTDQLGRFELPEYVDIKQASILRVNMFVDSSDAEWFQIVPEIELATSYKSLESQVFAVGGPVR